MTQKRTENRPFLRGKSSFDDVGFRKKCEEPFCVISFKGYKAERKTVFATDFHILKGREE